jgi:outer membrane protein
MLKKFAIISLLGMSASAMAGGFQVKVGGSIIDPTGDYKLAGVGTVEADSEYAFTPSVEYFFNDYFSTELLLANPIVHDVHLEGQEAVKLRHLPPTLTVKYNFKNSSGFTPYIGVGATAFLPWHEDSRGDLAGTKVNVKEDYGVAGQIGFNYLPDPKSNWGVFADVRYAEISPEVDIKAADGSRVANFDLDIDPFIYTVGFSYKF